MLACEVCSRSKNSAIQWRSVQNGVYSLKWRLTDRYLRWGTLAHPRPSRAEADQCKSSQFLHELRISGFPRFWVSPTCLRAKLLWMDAIYQDDSASLRVNMLWQKRCTFPMPRNVYWIIFSLLLLLLQANIADFGGNQWVTCFSDMAERLLNKKAVELGALKEVSIPENQIVCQKLLSPSVVRSVFCRRFPPFDFFFLRSFAWCRMRCTTTKCLPRQTGSVTMSKSGLRPTRTT